MAYTNCLYYIEGWGFFTGSSKVSLALSNAESEYGSSGMWGSGTAIYFVCELGVPPVAVLSGSSDDIDKIKILLDKQYYSRRLSYEVIDPRTIEVTSKYSSDIAEFLQYGCDDIVRNIEINGDFNVRCLPSYRDRIVWKNSPY